MPAASKATGAAPRLSGSGRPGRPEYQHWRVDGRENFAGGGVLNMKQYSDGLPFWVQFRVIRLLAPSGPDARVWASRLLTRSAA